MTNHSHPFRMPTTSEYCPIQRTTNCPLRISLATVVANTVSRYNELPTTRQSEIPSIYSIPAWGCPQTTMFRRWKTYPRDRTTGIIFVKLINFQQSHLNPILTDELTNGAWGLCEFIGNMVNRNKVQSGWKSSWHGIVALGKPDGCLHARLGRFQ